MKILRLISTTVVLALVAVTVFVVSKPDEKKNAMLYAFYGSVVDASNGQFQYTGALAIANEKDLKSAAASASNNSGTAILIGNGSGNIAEPITDIQIVGIGGVAYGDITTCEECKEEEQ